MSLGRASTSWIAAALLATIVVACSGSSGLIFTPRPAPGTTPSATQTAVPSPTVQPAAQTPGQPATGDPSPDGSPPATTVPRFEPLAGFPTDGALEVTGVTATPQGFPAVGFGALGDEGYFGRRQGIVWTSSDGRNWSQSREPALQDVTPQAVVALGDDVFLFGLLSTCSPLLYDYSCADVPDAGNAVWRSRGGGPWERLALPSQMQLGLIGDVAAGAGRLAVFGGTGTDQRASAIWLTNDGINWTETTDLAGLDPVSSLSLGAAGVVAFGTSYVAVEEDIRLVAAFSTDGIHFTPAAVPSMIGAAVDGVAEGGSGFVGVGYETSQDVSLGAIALHSTDGMNWSRAASTDGSFAGSGLIDVHVAPSGYVALGFTPSADDFTVQQGGAWISLDGQQWSSLGPLGTTFTDFGGSAIGSAGLVVFAAEQQGLETEDVTSTIKAWFAPADWLVP